MGMIQKAETEYQGLMKKRKMLEYDRMKIEEVIVKLDDQKEEALQKTHSKVTVDFGAVKSFKAVGAPREGSRGGSRIEALMDDEVMGVGAFSVSNGFLGI